MEVRKEIMQNTLRADSLERMLLVQQLYLENVTQDVGFIISHWQCCKKPAYHILGITFEGHLLVRGCGSWSGYFGNEVPVTSDILKDPRFEEPIYIDPRYHPY